MWKIKKKSKEDRNSCKCFYDDCTFTVQHNRTMKSQISFEAFVRNKFGLAPTLISSYRCQRHAMDITGMSDCKSKRGMSREYSFHDLDKIEKEAWNHFDVVIKMNNYIHCFNKE